MPQTHTTETKSFEEDDILFAVRRIILKRRLYGHCPDKEKREREAIKKYLYAPSNRSK